MFRRRLRVIRWPSSPPCSALSMLLGLLLNDAGDDTIAFSFPHALGFWRWQVGQNLSDPIEVEFPSLAEASTAQWGSLKDRWGPPPRPFVVAQRGWLEGQRGQTFSFCVPLPLDWWFALSRFSAFPTFRALLRSGKPGVKFLSRFPQYCRFFTR